MIRRFILVAVSALALAACSDANGARCALEAFGFKDIEITGYRAWGCGQNDNYHTGFRAKDVNGRVVTGVVCSGLFKGATVRLD